MGLRLVVLEMPGVSEENLIRRLIYEGESGHGRGFLYGIQGA